MVVGIEIIDEAEPHAGGELGELDLSGAGVEEGIHEVREAISNQVVEYERNLTEVRSAHLRPWSVIWSVMRKNSEAGTVTYCHELGSSSGKGRRK